MPDLNFEIVGAEVPAFAAVPTIIFKLSVVNGETSPMGYLQRIHSVALRCQIQLAVTRRHYNAEEQVKLLDVFGETKRWGDTLRNLLWMHTSTVVPQFSGSAVVDLPVPCTYDFEVVATKYFNALEDGNIPLLFLFSGTIFYEGEEGNLQVSQISWSKEASYRLPVTAWQEMIARYYPNSTFVRLHKDVFDQLFHYKAVHGLPTWESVIEDLLRKSSEEVQS